MAAGETSGLAACEASGVVPRESSLSSLWGEGVSFLQAAIGRLAPFNNSGDDDLACGIIDDVNDTIVPNANSERVVSDFFDTHRAWCLSQ